MGRACYKPVIEYCGGTEIGGGFVSGSFLQPQSLAAFSTPVMGCRLLILGDDGHPIVSFNPTLVNAVPMGNSTCLIINVKLNATNYFNFD